MDVGGKSRAERGNHGFQSMGQGSKLKSNNACFATSCESAGFSAIEQGELKAGPLSRVTSSGDPAGFLAKTGGSLQAGAGSQVRGGEWGFASDGPDSLLQAGAGCLSDGCAYVGFAANQGNMVCGSGSKAIKCRVAGFMSELCGNMKLGESCRAEECAVCYQSIGNGSMLTTGPSCAAANAQEGRGFSAMGGGVLQAGPGSRAHGGEVGHSAEDKGSVLQAGAGRSAEECSGAGFVSAETGKLVCGPGCKAKACTKAGFCSYTGGSTMVGEESGKPSTAMLAAFKQACMANWLLGPRAR